MASAMVLLMFYPAPCVAKAPESAGGTRNEVMADSVALPEVMVTARRPKEEIIPPNASPAANSNASTAIAWPTRCGISPECR